MKARQTTKIAVFDIDGTIFRSSLVIELVNELVKRRIFPKSVVREISREYVLWTNRKGSYENYIDKVVKAYVKHIRGKSFVRVKAAAQAVVRQQKDKTYRFTRDLVSRLKSRGFCLLAVSGSPRFIVEAYAKSAGFDAWEGTVLEVKNGRFTGQVLDLASALEKNEAIDKILHRLKIEPDWKKSVAVGDTESDFPMLSLVGNPVMFNPNRTLLKLVKGKRWRIVVERKDAVYDLEAFRLIE